MEQKVFAEQLFRGKRSSYNNSIKDRFLQSRLDNTQQQRVNVFKGSGLESGESIEYACPVTKYDRNGYKPRGRILVLTTKKIYLLNQKDYKMKDEIPAALLRGLSLSSHDDGIFVLHIKTEQNNHIKGDVIVETQHVLEAVTLIAWHTNLKSEVMIANGSITHKRRNGTDGTIEFSTGTKQFVGKGKKGQLMVTSPNN